MPGGPVKQLLASCRALRPGWPVRVPPPSAEAQAPLAGIPEARAHPHSLPSWALASTVTLSDPLLWPFWPLSLLMPPLPPSGLTPGITPALAAQVLGVHSWGSSDGTAWGPGLPWLKGESGECVGSCNCRGCRGGNHFS